MELKFRSLRADEVECRVATVSEKGCSLLLYKDARCDMNILDETVGAMNWKNDYEFINGRLFCTLYIYDSDKQEWVGKQDVGVESYSEAEKGQASDARKRSGFAFGIGRELYTAPFIWIKAGDVELSNKGGKVTTYDKFSVKSMTVKNGKITALQIVNDKTRKVVYTLGKVDTSAPVSDEDADEQLTKEVAAKTVSKAKVDTLRKMCTKDNVPESKVCEKFGISKLEELTEENFLYVANNWSKEFKA